MGTGRGDVLGSQMQMCLRRARAAEHETLMAGMFHRELSEYSLHPSFGLVSVSLKSHFVIDRWPTKICLRGFAPSGWWSVITSQGFGISVSLASMHKACHLIDPNRMTAVFLGQENLASHSAKPVPFDYMDNNALHLY